MPSTTNYGFIYPDVGGNRDAWGGILNNAIIAIDARIKTNTDTLTTAVAAAQSDANNAQSRVGTLESQNLSARITEALTAATTADGKAVNAQSRVGALEGQNLDSRLTTATNTANTAQSNATNAQSRVGVLEGQNLNSRLTSAESAITTVAGVASGASSAAATAQSTANDAGSAAAAAQATASAAMPSGGGNFTGLITVGGLAVPRIVNVANTGPDGSGLPGDLWFEV